MVETVIDDKYKSELNSYITTAKTETINPDKEQELIKIFKGLQNTKDSLEYCFRTDNRYTWKVLSDQKIENVEKKTKGFFPKRTSGIELTLTDANIFIPLKESGFLNLHIPFITDNKPRYKAQKDRIFLDIPIEKRSFAYDDETVQTYHMININRQAKNPIPQEYDERNFSHYVFLNSD